MAAIAVLLAIPVTLVLVEVVAAAIPRNRSSSTPTAEEALYGRVAVLVPAHNESAHLLPTLGDIQAQLRSIDRLVVVADNCTDDTAAVAMKAGADVVERSDSSRRGKGYALAHGLDYLSANSPDLVIIIDADCRLADHTIDRLARACAMTHRPVQALDLMVAPAESSINLKVAEFAWRVKNWVRPLGLMRLGLPCQLMGTGMAFPWNLIRSAGLASGSIVEDLKLGHDLALAGHAPVFCPSARVTSVFPMSRAAVETQRLRWEQGHIGLILKSAPRLGWQGIRRADCGLVALALDLAVPPVTLLGILVVTVSVISGLVAILGFSATALWLSAFNLAGLVAGVFLSWFKFGRDVLPPRSVWSIGYYALAKLALYGRIASRKSGAQWIRTDRTR
jgi:cellulose synthase/poly-beta-1,6-N-acetylglucosamine synthase-like glycosyltransferase